ncbi:hypothetical protein FDP41_013394 [Naegleria fowleri]|uniref:Protein kinase domain-containing protein n=1 Tax=Naegleria fowleri TaxID=5763 RepID=A0A6A5C2U3_NAEFO|nr:uncharacterized protein FDP41_013394 [Naegleria fowleri]KAF0980180.1 hypothetical protein FDP41_013394 [Naegleria fowleri]
MWRKKQIENIKQQQQHTAAAADTPQSVSPLSKPNLLTKIQIQEIIQKQVSIPIDRHSVADDEINGRGDDCSISSSSTGTTNYCLYYFTELNFPDVNNLLVFELRFSTQIITPVQKLQIINASKGENKKPIENTDDMDRDEDVLPCPTESSLNYTHYKFAVTVPPEFPNKNLSISLISIHGQGITDSVTRQQGASPSADISNNVTAAGAFQNKTSNFTHQQSIQYCVVDSQLRSSHNDSSLISVTEVIKFLKKLIFDAEKRNFESQQGDTLSMLFGNDKDLLTQLESQYFLPDYDSMVIEEKSLIFSKPEQLESWKREALLLCTLKHPSIVDHIGYGLRADKFQFKILMEHCKYGFLYDILFKPPAKKKSSLDTNNLKEQLRDPEIIYRVAISAAKALHYLHTEKKMIYVNVNSANIMLADEFQTKFLVDSSTCYVCNLAASGPISDISPSQSTENLIIPPALIKYYNPNVSSAETAVLVQYKSPEQILLPKRKYLLTSAVDIFAFGIVLYEIFTQRNPWKGTQPKTILEKVANGERPELSPQLVIVPQQLEIVELISWCWKQDPSERPNISQVLNALTQLSCKKAQ